MLPPMKKFLPLLFTAFLLPAPASARTVLRYSDHEPLEGMRPRFLKDVLFAAIERESAGRRRSRTIGTAPWPRAMTPCV